MGEKAPVIDFEKDNLSVPSNTAARRIGHDVISLLKTNFHLYLNDTAVAVQTWEELSLKNPIEPT